jgi:guanylate cyclase
MFDEESTETGLRPGGGRGLKALGARDLETRDERNARQLQVAMAAGSIVVVGGWGLTFLPMGRLDAAAYPFVYCAITAAMLAVFGMTRRIKLFRGPHTVLVLIAPFALHWHLGGFRASGGAMIWSLLAPVSATMFIGYWRALPWFFGAFALTILGWFREGPLSAGASPLTPSQASFYFAFNTIGFTIFLVFGMRHFIARIDQEKARGDRLLLNLFPSPIADSLKKHPERKIATRFEGVTVIFTDLVGFTGLSQTMPPGALVDLLNEIFRGFDELAAQHGLEKIKTIGDAYMAAAGLPEPCSDHARRAAHFALEAVEQLDRFSRQRGLALSMRVGIHTGELVAGVIGRQKLAYDLWGDTVNTASRMEHHGAPGRVHVSASTRAALGDTFRFEDRGAIEVKGKGEMRTFFLDRV